MRDLHRVGITEYNKHDGGIEFQGDLEDIYRINQSSRYGMHLYWEIARLPFNKDNLYKDMYNISWNKYLNIIHSFSVKVKSKKRHINEQYTALVIKDAIVDYFNKKYNKRPNVDRKTPDIPIYMYIEDSELKLYIDTTGDPLYKRGYRSEFVHEAPLNEVLAANLIANIDFKDKNLYDPMCGSGTLLIEAAMKDLNIPSQACRKDFVFKNWFNYDIELYKKIRTNLNDEIKTDCIDFYGSDNDDQCIQMLKGSIQKLGIEKKFTLRNRNIFDFIPKENSVIIFNPPYDVRISINKNLDEYYAKLSGKLKNQCKNCTIHIFTINNEYLDFIDMPCIDSKPIRNANLECVLNTYQT